MNLPFAVLKVDDALFDANPELHRIDNPVNFGSYHLPYSMGKDPEHYAATMDKVRLHMRELKENELLLEDTATVVFMHHKYSYPDGWGPKKVRKCLSILAGQWPLRRIDT